LAGAIVGAADEARLSSSTELKGEAAISRVLRIASNRLENLRHGGQGVKKCAIVPIRNA
jgi:hypothetical protein